LNSQTNTVFGNAVKTFVADLEANGNRVHSIPNFSRRFQIKRRRLYDVINVFTAVGCAHRIGTEDIQWFGRAQALVHLTQLCTERDIHNYNKTLADLFPADDCVGLPTLTHAFVLIFGAIHLKRLDVRDLSAFLSRNTTRYKSTLCKLYQITLVLAALRIVERTDAPCEVMIQSPFEEALQARSPVSLDALLNRPARGEDQITKRRDEYHQWALKHPRGKKSAPSGYEVARAAMDK
jgi:hypothetical protein